MATKPRTGKVAVVRGAERGIFVPIPETVEPRPVERVDKAPHDERNWCYEFKFDGYRMLARISGADVRIVSAPGNIWTPKFPYIVAALKRRHLTDAWLDGEVVVIHERRPDFGRLQKAIDNPILNAEIVYFAFDVLYCAGFDVRTLTLRDRRPLLEKLLPAAGDRIHVTDVMEGPARDLMAIAAELRLEGIVGKHLDSTYDRGWPWIKLKCRERQEFVVVGYVISSWSRAAIGALMVGLYQGKTLCRAGKIGTGFSDEDAHELFRRLEPLRRDTPPLEWPENKQRGIQWVEPSLLVEAEFAEWTSSGTIRHASFKGVRKDKPSRGVGRERSRPTP